MRGYPDVACAIADVSEASSCAETTDEHVTPSVHVSPPQTLASGTPAQPPLIAWQVPPLEAFDAQPEPERTASPISEVSET